MDEVELPGSNPFSVQNSVWGGWSANSFRAKGTVSRRTWGARLNCKGLDTSSQFRASPPQGPRSGAAHSLAKIASGPQLLHPSLTALLVQSDFLLFFFFCTTFLQSCLHPNVCFPENSANSKSSSRKPEGKTWSQDWLTGHLLGLRTPSPSFCEPRLGPGTRRQPSCLEVNSWWLGSHFFSKELSWLMKTVHTTADLVSRH